MTYKTEVCNINEPFFGLFKKSNQSPVDLLASMMASLSSLLRCHLVGQAYFLDIRKKTHGVKKPKTQEKAQTQA